MVSLIWHWDEIYRVTIQPLTDADEHHNDGDKTRHWPGCVGHEQRSARVLPLECDDLCGRNRVTTFSVQSSQVDR